MLPADAHRGSRAGLAGSEAPRLTGVPAGVYPDVSVSSPRQSTQNPCVGRESSNWTSVQQPANEFAVLGGPVDLHDARGSRRIAGAVGRPGNGAKRSVLGGRWSRTGGGKIGHRDDVRDV